MTKEREALKLALEALSGQGYYDTTQQREAITAIKEALAQPEQEPVAWLKVVNDWSCRPVLAIAYPNEPKAKPVYTSPPKREWVGLTDNEINTAWKKWIGTERANKSYTLAIEAKLKEKNA